MRLRRDLTLVGVLLALSLLGGTQAQAARDPVTAPTLLWKTYPLVQDPLSPRYRFQAIPVGGLPRPLPARVSEGGSGMTSQMLMLLMLTSLVAGVAGLLLFRPGLASAGYDWMSRHTPRKPRTEPTADMLVALKPSTATGPEPDEDLVEALEPVAPDPASEGDDEPDDPDEVVAPVAAEGAMDPDEGATEPRPQRRTLSAFPRPLREQAAAARGVRRCEIRLWHGYVKYQLYASSEGATASVALSGLFRLRDEDAPTEKALAELEDLIARLEAEGWAVVDDGPRWYDVELTRTDD